jgi:lysophospholipase L1-like esterase
MRLVHTALAVAAVALVAACSGPGRSPGAHVRAGPPSYYLALGDSLSQGVQPDATGVGVPTRQGYPDQVYAVLRRSHPALRLVKLGCPGETTGTMINGGICGYREGSQLAAAVAFLHAHRGQMFLVTIDIGANDLDDCLDSANPLKLASCFTTGVPGTVRNLTKIMTSLRTAAGPHVRIVGMSYYLPELAEWRHGLPGQAVAWLTERLAVGYNEVLEHVYATSGARVANVFGAFETTDFSGRTTVPGIGSVPRNVARVCQWTWECADPPRGPNQHANDAGYGVIARAFLSAAGLG